MRSEAAYRPDIDGLRALAVLAVIGFHAFPESIRGGFVGVDVFFVISGFLISGIILTRLENDNFSFVEFYVRRIRRILPALLPVLVACLAFGWFVLFPDEYRQLGLHTAAGAGFASNFVLMQESGYFDNAAETKPLLHLWSLSIEEQFYIVWPMLIALLWQKRHVLPAAILLALLASLAINLTATPVDPAEAYYSPLARFWELLAGSLLASLALSAPRPRTGHILSAAGLLLVAASVFAISRESPFPGWRALLPVAGTALLIAAGPGALVNRHVLSQPWLVRLGLISYPLYLWHWPLLSFMRIIEGQAPLATLRMAALCLALALAWLTYVCIERPIRTGGKGRLKAAAVTLLMVAAGCTGYLVHRQGGCPERIAGQAQQILAAAGEWGWPGKRMQQIGINGEEYQFHASSTPATALYWGDSYTQHYYPRIEALLDRDPERHKSALFSISACPPIPGVQSVKPCADHTGKVLAHALAAKDIDTVVISASLYKVFLNDSAEYMFSRGDTEEPLGPNRRGSELAYRSLQEMLVALRRSGRQVILVLPHPHGARLDPKLIVRRDLGKLGAYTIDGAGTTRESFEGRTREIRARLVALSDAAGATVIDPVEYLCGDISCPSLTERKEPIYRDAYHLRPKYVQQNATYIDVTLER